MKPWRSAREPGSASAVFVIDEPVEYARLLEQIIGPTGPLSLERVPTGPAEQGRNRRAQPLACFVGDLCSAVSTGACSTERRGVLTIGEIYFAVGCRIRARGCDRGAGS